MIPSVSRSWVYIGIVVVLATVIFSLLKRIPKTAGLASPTKYVRRNQNNASLILFIHGWNGYGASWTVFPQLAADDPRFHASDILLINYPTFIIRRNLNVAELALWILDSLKSDNALERYSKIAIVAHSMGGIIARELCVMSKLADSAMKVSVIVSIGTPYRGAKLAELGSSLGISTPLLEEIAPDSSFLKTLAMHWQSIASGLDMHGFASPHDDVVAVESAHAYCARCHFYPTWGHRDMVKPESHADERYALPMSLIKDAL